MKPITCPCCGAVLSVREKDKWEVIRMFVAVHLRSCDRAPADDKENRTIAVRVADEVTQDREGGDSDDDEE